MSQSVSPPAANADTQLLTSLGSVLLPQPPAADQFIDEMNNTANKPHRLRVGNGTTSERPYTAAAVLIPLLKRDNGVHVLLTRRTAHLHDHAGQIAFPGGRCEAEDSSPLATALRESSEEIGLPAANVCLLGYLPHYLTGTGFSIVPVVGKITPPTAFVPDTFEVAEIFEVPLNFFLDLSNHRQHQVNINGVLRSFYAMPYHDYFIWGATAGMLRALVMRINA